MNYKNSRDVAWQILIKNKVSSLPVDVQQICKANHIRCFTYGEGAQLIEKLKLKGNTIGNDAFSIGRVIFYDSQMPVTRQRFSIAHEIGHILLHNPTGATVYNREPSPSDDPIESEANIFASRLLAPLCVLHYLNVQTPEEIAKFCNISITAAQIRFERLCRVRNKDRDFLQAKGHGCFLSAPMERDVLRLFERYIQEHRRI